MSRVEVQNLHVNFGDARGVEGANFSVEEGEMLGLLGPSGCGKSTILRAIAGLAAATQGRIQIGDAAVTDTARNLFVLPEQRGLGMVFQSYAIWPHMTVAENVGFPLKVRKRPATEIAERVARVLRTVELDGLSERPATDLSGGQQQRVAIARALISEPGVLLLDEPLSNVDAKLRLQMGQELRAIQQRTGVTAIYVTHDQSEALSLCDRIVVLDRGRVQQIGTPQEIYQQPQSPFVGWFIGNSSFLSGTVVATRPHSGGASAEVRLDGTDTILVARIVSEKIESGSAVTLLVRPEDVRIAESGAGIAATVTETAYLGDRWHCRASIGSQTIGFFGERGSSLRSHSPTTLVVAERAAICFAAGAAQIDSARLDPAGTV